MTPSATRAALLRFGPFELDVEGEQLVREGRIVRLQPQPFKLLCLLATQPGKLVTRDEIRTALWSGDTFVDFDQGVNFAIRQVRDALGEDAERPAYVQTVPRRGYKFVAPVTTVAEDKAPILNTPTQDLAKLMWANISELRLAEQRRHRRLQLIRRIAMIASAVAGASLLLFLLLRG